MVVDVEHAAALLSEVRSSRRSIPELPDGLRPGPWSEAYAIQDEHHALAGWDTAALKVGCTSTAAQEALRIDEPIGGRIPAEAIFDSGVRLRSAMFLHPPLIECEFAFRIGVDIALTDIFSSRADVARVVDAVAPAVELVDSRFIDFRKVSGPSLVADNSVAAGIVIGQPLSPLSVPEPAGVSVVLTSNDSELARGTGAAVLGDPYQSLAWAVGHERERGRSISVGTWVITGSCTGLVPCPVGEDVVATFAGLGQVEFALDP